MPNITFVPGTDGRANLVVRGDLAACNLIAITIEPEGGSSAPTSDVLIISDLTRPDSAGYLGRLMLAGIRLV